MKLVRQNTSYSWLFNAMVNIALPAGRVSIVTNVIRMHQLIYIKPGVVTQALLSIQPQRVKVLNIY